MLKLLLDQTKHNGLQQHYCFSWVFQMQIIPRCAKNMQFELHKCLKIRTNVLEVTETHTHGASYGTERLRKSFSVCVRIRSHPPSSIIMVFTEKNDETCSMWLRLYRNRSVTVYRGKDAQKRTFYRKQYKKKGKF